MKAKFSFLQCCLLIIVSCLLTQKVYAQADTPQNVPLIQTNDWGTLGRSVLPPPVPFSASIANAQLSITCTAPLYDVCIVLKNTYGNIVYEQEYAAAQTSFIAISLDSLPEGDYTLVITNDYGGRLTGEFQW